MNPLTLERRAEALLDIRTRALARAGKPLAAAYRPPTPVKMKKDHIAYQWT